MKRVKNKSLLALKRSFFSFSLLPTHTARIGAIKSDSDSGDGNGKRCAVWVHDTLRLVVADSNVKQEG